MNYINYWNQVLFNLIQVDHKPKKYIVYISILFLFGWCKYFKMFMSLDNGKKRFINAEKIFKKNQSIPQPISIEFWITFNSNNFFLNYVLFPDWKNIFSLK